MAKTKAPTMAELRKLAGALDCGVTHRPDAHYWVSLLHGAAWDTAKIHHDATSAFSAPEARILLAAGLTAVIRARREKP